MQDNTYMVVYIDVEDDKVGWVYKSHSLPDPTNKDFEQRKSFRDIKGKFMGELQEVRARAHASFYVAKSPG